MNNLIIFSKNRACQLNLLLDSLHKYCNTLFDVITVLYKADNNFIVGYEILKTRHKNIFFRNEINFRNDLLSLVDLKYKTTTFMVDDAVIYSNVDEYKTVIEECLNSDIICFSLRLGLNCNYSHPANIKYNIGSYEDKGYIIEFEYDKQLGDFNYPLSTDGHIFDTNLLFSMMNIIGFNNPNTLEANLQKFTNSNFLPKKLVSFKESKLVSIPVNLVNDVFNNRHGLDFYISEHELNKKYLNGEVIDLESLDFSGINGPHKEIIYKYNGK